MKERDPGLANLTKTAHSLSDRIKMLDKSRWVSEFSWNQLKTLATYMESYSVEKGKVILHEGLRDANMLLIMQGQVDIVKEDHNRSQRAIATLGPGKTFGEMSLIDGEPRSASAIATTPVILLMLSVDNFSHLISKTPHIGAMLALKIAKLMSQRLRLTSGKLVECLCTCSGFVAGSPSTDEL